MNPTYRKILFIMIWYLIYPNFWLFLLVPEIFFNPEFLLFLLILLLSYFFGVIDTLIRPFSESIQEDATTNPIYNLILLVIFLLNPIFIAIAFNESQIMISQYIPFWNNILVSSIGILLLLTGGLITITGRYQLKGFGSGVLTIEEDHQLITTGIFRYIRHPIYAGGLLGVFGFYFAFQSLFVLISLTLVYFVVFRHRFLFEEQLMIEKFGDEYREYMKRTKGLIPYLY